MKIFDNQEMKNYSNMRVGGKAKRLIILESKEEIVDVYKEMEQMFYSLITLWIRLLFAQKN